MFIDSSCYDSDDSDDDDDEIRDHREVSNGMELLMVWRSGKRVKNAKNDFPNIVNKYINDNGIKLESSKRKGISISEILRES